MVRAGHLTDHLRLIVGGDDMHLRAQSAPDESPHQRGPDAHDQHRDSHHTGWVARIETEAADYGTVHS